MRIAQIAPLYESVPPKFYGGTERIVHYLTEELVSLGHDVTLFASGDSKTSAHLIPGSANALRLDKSTKDPIAHHVLLAEKVFQAAPEFDIIHSHIDYFCFPHARHSATPLVATMHGRMDLPDYVPLYQEFHEAAVVSISRAQRTPLPWLNWIGNVYHGLPAGRFRYHGAQGKYLAFLGRVSREKRVDVAIEIAKRSGMQIKIAAKVDKQDMDFFTEAVKPLLDHPLVEFIGEIGDDEKSEFLGNAAALLFPIEWPEPFGIVMTEAMACGTPVIAFPHGSVPEIMEHGVTGFIVSGIEEAVQAVKKIPEISRGKCREVFDQRFTARRMAEDYVQVYRKVLSFEEDALKAS